MRRARRCGLLLLLASCGEGHPAKAPPRHEAPFSPANEAGAARAAVDAGAAPVGPARCGEAPLREPRGGAHATEIVVDASPAGKTSERTPPKELQVSRDGATLLAVREDGAALVWDLREDRLRARLARTPLPVRRSRPAGEEEEPPNESFTLGGDGARVVGLSWSQGEHGWQILLTERAWDSASGKLVSSRSRTASAYKLIATPDLARRALWANGYFGDAGGDLLLAGAPSPTQTAIGARKRGLVLDASWSEDGTRLAVTRSLSGDNLSNSGRAGHASMLEMWDMTAEGARAPLRFEAPLESGEVAGFSGGRALVVTSGNDRTVVHDALTGTELGTLDAVGEVLPSARRDVVVVHGIAAPAKVSHAGARAGDVVIHDAVTGARRLGIAIPNEPPSGAAAFAALRPDGLRLAIGNGARACVVSLDDGALLTDLAWSGELHWSADGAALQDVVESATDVRLRTVRLEDETVEDRVVWFGPR